MTISDGEVRFNYRDSVLKLLFKFSSPTRDDVHTYLCRQDHCPNVSGKCNFAAGSIKGSSCRHVINIKSLVDNLGALLNTILDV